MPFQYETFNDGEPLSARKIQKTTNNQFEMAQTYQERPRGLIVNKSIPIGYSSGTITVAADTAVQELISVSPTIYPDRYYLVEGSIGRAVNTGGFAAAAFGAFLMIEGIYVSAMNTVTDWSVESVSSVYINHVFTSPSNIPQIGAKKVFKLLADEYTNVAGFSISYVDNTFHGRVRLSIIDMGGVVKANYYG